MQVVYLLAKGIFWISLFLLLLGLWRPWVVLWWLEYQNRLRVIKYYGSIMTVAGILWLITKGTRLY
ncbi:hypothetical protein [Nafulsella turpanensis]|uniref:hypothetical protein n=1 Tax=Nafulsella turpanensis TaxID=1265690 RepID=UPI0003497FD8|nr:hypothetical protein [Nafulsella turpanensis]